MHNSVFEAKIYQRTCSKCGYSYYVVVGARNVRWDAVTKRAIFMHFKKSDHLCLRGYRQLLWNALII